MVSQANFGRAEILASGVYRLRGPKDGRWYAEARRSRRGFPIPLAWASKPPGRLTPASPVPQLEVRDARAAP